MTPAAREKTLDRLYDAVKKSAQLSLGGERAYSIVGPAIRRAFVAQAILHQAQGQDSSIPAERVREVQAALYDRLTSDEDFQA